MTELYEVTRIHIATHEMSNPFSVWIAKDLSADVAIEKIRKLYDINTNKYIITISRVPTID